LYFIFTLAAAASFDAFFLPASENTTKIQHFNISQIRNNAVIQYCNIQWVTSLFDLAFRLAKPLAER